MTMEFLMFTIVMSKQNQSPMKTCLYLVSPLHQPVCLILNRVAKDMSAGLAGLARSPN